MIAIRAATPADAGEMLTVARLLPDWFNQGGLAQMAIDFRTQHGAVAELAGRIVGFVTWWPAGEPGVMEMTWLGVHPDVRFQGIGRRLVAEAEAGARAQGAHRVLVSTLADTVEYAPYAETRRFYHAAGYSDERVDPDHYGPGEDRLLLAKGL